MFNGCYSLTELPDISKWNGENFDNITFIFNGCSSLLSYPYISKWNINYNKYTSEFYKIADSYSSNFIISDIISDKESKELNLSSDNNLFSNNKVNNDYEINPFVNAEENEKLNEYYENFYK